MIIFTKKCNYESATIQRALQTISTVLTFAVSESRPKKMGCCLKRNKAEQCKHALFEDKNNSLCYSKQMLCKKKIDFALSSYIKDHIT